MTIAPDFFSFSTLAASFSGTRFLKCATCGCRPHAGRIVEIFCANGNGVQGTLPFALLYLCFSHLRRFEGALEAHRDKRIQTRLKFGNSL
jgi:hypothetical protein